MILLSSSKLNCIYFEFTYHYCVSVLQLCTEKKKEWRSQLPLSLWLPLLYLVSGVSVWHDCLTDCLIDSRVCCIKASIIVTPLIVTFMLHLASDDMKLNQRGETETFLTGLMRS